LTEAFLSNLLPTSRTPNEFGVLEGWGVEDSNL
jgi:hypothetical protein